MISFDLSRIENHAIEIVSFKIGMMKEISMGKVYMIIFEIDFMFTFLHAYMTGVKALLLHCDNTR